jgi:hypothetical protein
MATRSHKSVGEEIGQRTARNQDPYTPKGGYKEAAFCGECGAVYRNKRWSAGEAMTAPAGMHQVVCPACLRMHDHNPAGVVTLSGDYLRQKADAILYDIKHIEAMFRRKNPLGRIMEIEKEEGRITISTTEDRLAQKMGREVFKAHKGELHYQWAHDQNLVRVSWSR